MRCITNVLKFTYTTRLLTCFVVLYPVHHTVNTSKLRQYVISNIKLYEVLPQSQCTPAKTKMLLELFSPPSIPSPSLPLRHIDHCNHPVSHLVSSLLSMYSITMIEYIYAKWHACCSYPSHLILWQLSPPSLITIKLHPHFWKQFILFVSVTQHNESTSVTKHNESTGVTQHNESTSMTQDNESTSMTKHNESTSVTQHNESTSVAQHNESTSLQPKYLPLCLLHHDIRYQACR
jgi:hypothetical protein